MKLIAILLCICIIAVLVIVVLSKRIISINKKYKVMENNYEVLIKEQNNWKKFTDKREEIHNETNRQKEELDTGNPDTDFNASVDILHNSIKERNGKSTSP